MRGEIAASILTTAAPDVTLLHFVSELGNNGAVKGNGRSAVH